MYNQSIIEKNLLAEVTVSYKKKQPMSELPKVKSSNDAVDYLRSVWNQDTIDYSEDFVVLLLNRGNRILGWARISTGGIAGTVCDPKVIFTLALLVGASAVVLSHNHPSGNTTPSTQDVTLTRKIKEGGRALDIQVLDHLIITSEGHYSFTDNGNL